MTTKNITQNEYYISENNRPIKNAINYAFTGKTIKERGNQISYSFNEKTNELIFREGSMGRGTVFMDKNIVDLSIDGKLGWVTLFTDPSGYKTFGFYAKNPSRLGFVCFTNYTLGGYEFETKHPEFAMLPSEKVRFQYDGEGWNIYGEDTLIGRVTPQDFPLTSSETSELIPMIGFKIDPGINLPYSIKVKGYKKSTDYELKSRELLRDYVKTDWVAYETIVSADALNNIESELEYLSNLSKIIDTRLTELSETISEHSNSKDVHITLEEKQAFQNKMEKSVFDSHDSDLAKHNQFMDGDTKKQIEFGINSDLGCLTVNISEVTK